MKKFFCVFVLMIFTLIAGCDLQPKIASIPDSIGDFIAERYPTLLAEPDSEIYKTAVADYGVYASAAEYGNGDVTDADYVLYSPVDDYMMPAQDTDVESDDVGMPDEEDQEMVEAEEYGIEPDTDIDDLHVPDYVDGKPVVPEKPNVKLSGTELKPEQIVVKQEEKSDLVLAPIREVTIEKGDTLYSVSRKYSVPVNDLAVMNKISAPFTLSVGQKLKVPDVVEAKKSDAVRSSGVAMDKKPDVKKAKETPIRKQDTSGVTKKSEAGAAKKTDVSNSNVKTVPDKKITSKKDMDVKKTGDKKVDKKSDAGKKVASKKTDVKKPEIKKTDEKKTVKDTNVSTKNASKADTKKTVQKTEKKKSSTKQLAARSSSKFSWPVRGKILSGYGSKSNGLFNDGINIKAARGTTVLASENGFVAYAGNEVKGMGNLVIIQHSDGWMTVYAHMDSMNVRRGSTVLVGQKIGTVGASGKVDQPQLHFEIRKGTKAYNPVNYLKK